LSPVFATIPDGRKQLCSADFRRLHAWNSWPLLSAFHLYFYLHPPALVLVTYYLLSLSHPNHTSLSCIDFADLTYSRCRSDHEPAYCRCRLYNAPNRHVHHVCNEASRFKNTCVFSDSPDFISKTRGCGRAEANGSSSCWSYT
jgi:hypothetical protein